MSKSPLKNADYRALLGRLCRFHPGVRHLFQLAVLPYDKSSLFPTFIGRSLDRREVQTYPEWKVQTSFRNLNLRRRKRSKHSTIYILPIGPFPATLRKTSLDGMEISIFELMEDFVGVFFNGMSIKLMDEVNVTQVSCKSRFHAVTGKLQLLVTGETY